MTEEITACDIKTAILNGELLINYANIICFIAESFIATIK